MAQDPKKQDDKQGKQEVTGMPPTPEKLTPLGAPVDERFAGGPPPAPTPNNMAEKPDKQEHPAQRRPKSEGEDDTKEDPRSKRR